MRSRLITSAIGFVLVVGLLLLGAALSKSAAVSGPGGDSTVTTDRGVAALRMLLVERGLDVERSGGALAGVERLSTVVILEPGAFSDALGVRLPELIRHLDRGGMVVLGGNFGEDFIRDLSGIDITVTGASSITSELTGPIAGVVGRVRGEGVRSFAVDDEDSAGWSVLAGSRQEAAVVAAEVTGGTIVAFADVGPFTNALIDEAENGALLAGLLSRWTTVVFDDFVHGYREPVEGVAAGSWFSLAPPRAQWMLRLLAVAGFLWLVTYGRRLGPPEQQVRRLPPARSEHIRSVAATLDRNRDISDAVEPTRQTAIRALERLVGVGAATDRDALLTAGRSAGLDTKQVHAILDGPTGVEDALMMDGALAKLLGLYGGTPGRSSTRIGEVSDGG